MAKQKNQTENVFFNKNVFDLNQKLLPVIQAFRLLKKDKRNECRNTKNPIKNFNFLLCFSRFA